MLLHPYLLQVTATELALKNLNEMTQTAIARSPFLLIGLVVIVFFWLLGQVARYIIWQVGERTRLDVVLLRILGSLAAGVVVLLGCLIAAVIIFPSFQPVNLVAGLGITSVAIGFAFKDVLQNIFAGLLILWRKPFHVGDQIRSSEYEGTVEEINIRSTYIKTYDGERAVIPNSAIYGNSVLVRTAFSHRRVVLKIGIGYLDSIDQARRIIFEVLEGIPGIMQDPGPWVYVSDLAPSSVDLLVYFWTGSEQANVLSVKHQAATAIKCALDEAGIDIPYPHQVVLFHNANGTRKGDQPLPGMDRSAQPERDRQASSEAGRSRPSGT